MINKDKLLLLQSKINSAAFLSGLLPPSGISLDAYDQAQDDLFEANQIVNGLVADIEKANKKGRGKER